MGLGSDEETCKNEFIEAMRARLEAEEPGSGANVDEPAVQENLGALGLAVFSILTVHAETISNLSTDNDFWQWVADVNTWLSELENWQQGVAQAFASWTPVQPAEQDLKTALLAVPSPGSAPTQAPTTLKGKIE